MIEIPLFSLFYALKGGAHASLRTKAGLKLGMEFHDNNAINMTIPQAIAWFFMDGKVLSSMGVFLYGYFTTLTKVGFDTVPIFTGNVWHALFLAGMWLLAVVPSIGEEISAVGGYKGGWGPYLTHFSRMYGVKKAIQRGVFTGAVMAFAVGNMWLIPLGALMPLCYYAGTSYAQKKTGLVNAPWNYGEWIFGAIIGLGV